MVDRQFWSNEAGTFFYGYIRDAFDVQSGGGQHDSGIAEGNQCTWFHIFRKAKALFRLGTVSDGDPAGLQFQFRQFHDEILTDIACIFQIMIHLRGGDEKIMGRLDHKIMVSGTA